MEGWGHRIQGLAPAGGCSPLSRSALVDVAAPGPGEVVVGLGCGGCREAAAVAARVAPGGRVVIVLTRDEELDFGAVPAGPTRPLVVRGDVAATGLRSAIADVVISNCSAAARADRPAMLRELHRVLRPGGRLVASELVALHPARHGAYRRARAADALSEAEYLELVHGAGFERTTLLQRTAPYEEHGRLVLSLTIGARRG